MAKRKNDISTAEKQMKRSKMIVGEVTMKLALTKDEINAVLYKPKGQIARDFKKYMNFMLQYGARKLEEDSNVKECKESEE